jgi:hypothetical protein
MISDVDERTAGKSGLLFLIICSNRKVRGGDGAYDPSSSMFQALPQHTAALQERRRRALSILKLAEVTREGVPLRDLPYNLDLVEGPDFGGTESPAYMSALSRYQGRFYSTLTDADRQRIKGAGHHVLILSGLYGLLRPLERIQAYSCHVLDHPSIPKVWKDDGFLTELLLDYIRTRDVRRVFDLTGQKGYRDLIQWPRVPEHLDVLHAFGDQNGGPAVLPALAQVAAYLLELSGAELLNIPSGYRVQTAYENVSLEPLPQPPPGFPVEQESGRPILDHPRDIPISGGDHQTMFGRKIQSMRDLPAEVGPIFELVSRNPEVLKVHLGRFGTKGDRAATSFTLSLSHPREGMGVIHAKIHGPGRIGRWQEIEIRITRERETANYVLLKKLLDDHGFS